MKVNNTVSPSIIFNEKQKFTESNAVDKKISTTSDTLSLSTNLDPSEKMVQLAKTYNVRSITEDEIAHLSTELKEAGIISSDVHAVMSFPRREASARQGAKINVDEKFDFLDESKKALEFLKLNNAPPYTVEIQKNIVDTLSTLDRAR